VFKRFTIHLAKRHLFWSCKFKIPRPPWSLGRHKMSHLASLHLCSLAKPCRKNLDPKWSRFLRTPLGSSKKDIMNIRSLLNTAFSRTNLPQRIDILLSNTRAFAGSILRLYSIQNLGVIYGALGYLNIWKGNSPNYNQREKYRKTSSLWPQTVRGSCWFSPHPTLSLQPWFSYMCDIIRIVFYFCDFRYVRTAHTFC
jgi:hypothetical protein